MGICFEVWAGITLFWAVAPVGILQRAMLGGLGLGLDMGEVTGSLGGVVG